MKDNKTTGVIEPSLCPICGEQNGCAMSQSSLIDQSGIDQSDCENTPNEQTPDSVRAQGCWCMTVEFPKNYTDYIPVDALRKSCICQACLEKIANNEIPPANR